MQPSQYFPTETASNAEASKRTPKPRSKGERERNFVQELECKASSRARHNSALSRLTQFAMAERQNVDKNPMGKRRRFRKRNTSRRKTEREVPPHASHVKNRKQNTESQNRKIFTYMEAPKRRRHFCQAHRPPYSNPALQGQKTKTTYERG